VPAELEEFTVFTVRFTVTVWIVVNLSIGLPGKESQVVTLLQLNCIYASILRRQEKPLAGFQTALMIVTELGKYLALAVVADQMISDNQFSSISHFGAVTTISTFCLVFRTTSP